MALSDKLQQLKDAGFDVPTNALHFSRDKELADRGVRCVFKCNCGKEYESPIPLSEYDHGCGKKARKTWPRS